MLPIVTGAIPREYKISPELPKCLNFDTKTGKIDGVCNDLSSYYTTVYTITAVSDYSNYAVTLDLKIMKSDIFEERCLMRGKLVVTVITQVEQHPNDMGYRLINSKDDILIDRMKGSFVANRTYNLRICVEPDWYTLQLVDYSNYGWNSGNVKIKVGSSIIGKYVVEARDLDYIRNITMHRISIFISLFL